MLPKGFSKATKGIQNCLSNLLKTGSCYALLFIALFIVQLIFVGPYRISARTASLKAFSATKRSINRTDVPADTDKNLSVRILCWIMTGKQFHSTRAISVKETWAKRCDKYVFASDEEDPGLPAVNLGTPSGREFLWEKTRNMLSYIYQRYADEFDWFMKADDDTYVIVDNLRSFLRSKDPDMSVYFGCRIRWVKPSTQGYMSGGAGYVLSKTALRKFVEEALNNKTICSKSGDYEDVEVGLCLENIGVEAGDTRDEQQRHRFLPLSLEKFFVWNDGDIMAKWFKHYSLYPIKTNETLVSDKLITMHYISPSMMRALDHLLYNVPRQRNA